ncbi:hypothetical protein N9W00_00410 [Arcobacteraceae bacterium]|nr:hypothetical protein [Arcobacteraceae bacterium]
MKNIYLILVLLYLSIVPLFAVNNENLHKAKALFMDEKYQASIDILEKILEDDISNININFYIGRSYFELKKYERALVYFERITIINENHLRTYLEIAHTYMKLGLNEAALTNFKFIMKSAAPYYIKENVENYIRFIENKKEKHLFRTIVIAGVAHDNNIDNVTDTTTYSTPNWKDLTVLDKQLSDQNFILGVTGIHNYKIDDKFNLENIINFTSQSFFKYTEKNLFILDYKLYLLQKMNKNNLYYGFNYANINLDSTGYLDIVALDFGYQKQLDKNYGLYSSLEYITKTYSQITNEKLDSNVIQLNIGTNYNTLEYGKFKLTYSNIRENLDIQNTTTSDKIGNQFVLSNIYKKSNKLSLIAAATYLNTKENDDDSIFEVKRVDTFYSLGYTLSYNLKRNLNLSTTFKYIQNNSNIDIYSYDKQTIDFFIRKSF